MHKAALTLSSKIQLLKNAWSIKFEFTDLVKMNSGAGAWFSGWLRCHSGHLHPISKYLGSSPLRLHSVQLPAKAHPGR